MTHWYSVFVVVPLSAIVLLLALSGQTVSAKEGKQDFFDWNYAVWVWENLKTGDAYDAEWAKLKAATDKWQELHKREPERAMEELKTSSEAVLIKKGLDLGRVYHWWASKRQGEFWQVFEPNCYEGGDTYSLLSGNNGYRVDDIWARANIFTGKCDYPDWRVAAEKTADADQKRAFMAQVESQRDFIEKQRRKKGL